MIYLSETKIPQRPKIEIKSLSDLIFGLALSIGAVALITNINSINSEAVLQGDIAIFGFSFFLLISVWMAHTKIMSVLPVENWLTLTLNSALLFTVSMEPFLYNVLVLDQNLSSQISSEYFALDLGVMNTVLGFFSLVVGSEQRKLVPRDLTKGFKIESARRFVTATLFFISIAPFFWGMGPDQFRWRYYLWILILIISASQRRSMDILGLIRKHRQKTSDSSPGSVPGSQ
jgi:uncharacterized membrane protein